MTASTKDWKPARITSEDERRGGSTDYITLEPGENFLGYCLFVGDPAAPEVGYYEYLEHWQNDTRKRIVCPGVSVCPLCADGDRPKTRAKALWLVTEDEKGTVLVDGEGNPAPQLRIMSLNYNVIKMFTAMRKAGDKYFGRLLRMTLTDDRGNWTIFPKDDTLTKTAINAALKGPNVPNFDDLVTAQLRKSFEGFELREAMEAAASGDEPEEPAAPAPAPAAGKGKGKAEPEPEAASADWPDDAEGLIVIVEEVSEDANWFLATHADYDGSKKVWTTDNVELDFSDLSTAQAIAITGSLDNDGEYILSDEPVLVEEGDEPAAAAPTEEEAGELPAALADVQAVVTGEVDTENWAIPVKVEELGIEFLLYVLESVKGIDWADYKEGTVITIVEAKRDASGDLCTKTVPTVGAAATGKGKAAAGKGGPKKSA